MRVLCLGDSNTYGYDPRSYLGGRYPEDARWVDLLAKRTGWDFVNTGENGMGIPWRAYERLWVRRTLEDCMPVDSVIVMLGGNDLLQGTGAEETGRRMESFITELPIPREDILLIAPPHMRPGAWITDPRLTEESLQLAKIYHALAEKLKIRFWDAGAWDIPLTFDGVHFTEEGHRKFAQALYQPLMDWKR